MPDKAETFLSDAISEAANKNTDSLNLPTTYNGSPYLLSNLHPDQKDIMLYILSKLHQWIDDYNNSTTTFMPLRLTICGQAGSGKSVLIRTLVSVLRQMFRRNDCCYVCAPTGSAAYQAGGQTIHSLFGIKSSQTSYNVTPTLQQKLLQKFANIVCLIVDERSMVCSEILATMESYASATFHCGQNHNKRWGHVPLLLFVGDDYQLPPIMPGAFEAFENHTKRSQRLCRHKRTKQQAHIAHGEHLFLQLGEDVMVLTVSKRTNDSQQHFRDILQQTRAADDQSLSHSNIELLCNLHLMSPNFTDIEREELQQDSLFLFANKAPRDAHNKHKLHAEHSPSNPVATIKARTQKKGVLVSNNAHYDTSTPPATTLCRHAQVSISGCNIHPTWGLYNGSIGEVLDIVFHPDANPNHGDLPRYILLRLPDYNGPALFPEDPKVVPIVPVKCMCNKHCCERLFVPLTLAYSKTVHTYQGQSAGPTDKDKPQNSVQRIICDPGTRAFEGTNIGLFYTILSRATTIGDTSSNTDHKDSAIYFIGDNMNKDRITNITLSKNGTPYQKVQKRTAWTNYLKQNTHTSNISTDQANFLLHWATNTTYSHHTLRNIIRYHA